MPFDRRTFLQTGAAAALASCVRVPAAAPADSASPMRETSSADREIASASIFSSRYLRRFVPGTYTARFGVKESSGLGMGFAELQVAAAA